MMRNLSLAFASAASLLIAEAAIAKRDQSTRVNVGEQAHGARVSIAGQPSLASFDEWAEAGVTTVINLRTLGEMAHVPFDEQTEVEARGMRYIHIPTPSGASFSPSHLQRLSTALENVDGGVALHCRSGRRAERALQALKNMAAPTNAEAVAPGR